MPAKYEILRPLDDDSATTLYVAHAAAKGKKQPTGKDLWFRRFKTRKPEDLEGLKELYGQIATLDSPHVEKPVDFGTDKEGFFVVTRPLEGETLEQTLRRGPLTAEEFETVALQLLAALDLLHDQAVVHGSIRPDYVHILGGSRKDWQVVLTGFGHGFAVREDSKEAQIRAYRCTAPEQWQDGTTRRRTDVYAVGCVLYEALAARAPFDGRAVKELRMKHLTHDLAPLQKLAPHVPPWMCAWVMHLLAADPEQRPRKAAVARELFEKRVAPKLPELPPRSEALKGPLTPPTTPPVSFGIGAGPGVAADSPQPQQPPTASSMPVLRPPQAPLPVAQVHPNPRGHGQAPAKSGTQPQPAHPPLTPPPASAPVVLPAAQAARHVTSSTIPITTREPLAGGRGKTGPTPPGAKKISGAGLRGSAAAAPGGPQRPSTGLRPPTGGAPRRPPASMTAVGARGKDWKRIAIPAASVLVLLALFGLSRCGLNEKPPPPPPAKAAPGTGAKGQ